MTPIFSGVCRSTDSEAMNIVEIINEVKEICGDDVHIYTGNGHTTTKISAGMAYLSHGVIAAGRFRYELNKGLGQKKLSKLKKNIVLLNKVGKLLKNEPTLGSNRYEKTYLCRWIECPHNGRGSWLPDFEECISNGNAY